jgi:hypothetical protein
LETVGVGEELEFCPGLMAGGRLALGIPIAGPVDGRLVGVAPGGGPSGLTGAPMEPADPGVASVRFAGAEANPPPSGVGGLFTGRPGFKAALPEASAGVGTATIPAGDPDAVGLIIVLPGGLVDGLPAELAGPKPLALRGSGAAGGEGLGIEFNRGMFGFSANEPAADKPDGDAFRSAGCGRLRSESSVKGLPTGLIGRGGRASAGLFESVEPAVAAIAGESGCPAPGNSEPGKRLGVRNPLPSPEAERGRGDPRGFAGLLGRPGLGRPVSGAGRIPVSEAPVPEGLPPGGNGVPASRPEGVWPAAPVGKRPASGDADGVGEAGRSAGGGAAPRAGGSAAMPGCEPLLAAADRLLARLRSSPVAPGLAETPSRVGVNRSSAELAVPDAELPPEVTVPAGRMLGGRAVRAVELASVSAGLVWLATRMGGSVVPGPPSPPVSSGKGGFCVEAASAKCGPTSVPLLSAIAPAGMELTKR